MKKKNSFRINFSHQDPVFANIFSIRTSQEKTPIKLRAPYTNLVLVVFQMSEDDITFTSLLKNAKTRNEIQKL